MLEVSRLTRSYGGFKAVDNVSLTIGNGESVGLLGHNGAGKTTIMKMISGYLEPEQSTTMESDESGHPAHRRISRSGFREVEFYHYFSR